MPEKKPTQWRWRTVCSLIVGLGFLLLILGLSLYFFIIPFVVDSKIRENSQLLEGSRLMEEWKTPKYNMLFKLYVYSVKNPDEFMAGDKPVVTGMGPYTFREKMEHKVIGVKDGKVKYKIISNYHFDPELSCLTCILGNRVWVPNMIYQKFVEAASTPGMEAAATTLLSQTAFLEVEVGELLFDGYKDPFLDKVCDIPFMNFVCDSILDLPDRIGFFFEKNNTIGSTFEISDGSQSVETLGRVLTWNDKSILDESWWSSKDARILRGSAGALFPPFIKKQDRLWVFVEQLCRSIYLDFEEEIEYKGIPAYRFVLPASVFDSSLNENKGFCNPTEKRFFSSQGESDDCWPKGLLEISKCQRSQPPIIISLPNFLYADDEVSQSVVGLNKSEVARDSIIVDIEPRTGVVLKAQRRSQVNIEMWKGKDIKFPANLKKMKSSIVPVLIVHEDVEIDNNSLNMLRSELIETERLALIVAKFFMFVGFLTLIVGFVLTFYWMGVFNSCLSRHGVHNIDPLPNYVPKNGVEKI
ncbi:unnamed protein product [Auanema sp. JU1783]|nr:unnamed protein product [Auanema sp. JU1783]